MHTHVIALIYFSAFLWCRHIAFLFSFENCPCMNFVPFGVLDILCPYKSKRSINESMLSLSIIHHLYIINPRVIIFQLLHTYGYGRLSGLRRRKWRPVISAARRQIPFTGRRQTLPSAAAAAAAFLGAHAPPVEQAALAEAAGVVLLDADGGADEVVAAPPVERPASRLAHVGLGSCTHAQKTIYKINTNQFNHKAVWRLTYQ